MVRQLLVGRSGLRSSQVALGTMTFGDTRKWGADAAAAKAITTRFLDAGGTTIDTAPNYAGGGSEEIVGALTEGIRDEVVLTTKYTAAASQHPLAGGNSRRSMTQSVEASLRRLRTDRIDLLWLHFWDGTTPLDEILRAADDLVSAGKILYFGMSDTPAWLVARAATMAELRRITPVIAIQAEYNVATRGIERDLLPMADALDLGCFCWGPLAAGALAGGDRTRAPADRIAPGTATVRDALLALSDRLSIPPHRLALRWIMQSGRGRIPIIGARTEDQIADLLDGLSDPLDSEAMAEMGAFADGGTLFPTPLIESRYLRGFAFGDVSRFDLPVAPRA